ncbi:MAG: ribonuclease HII [Clostridia bacterium]|nr:ribonuclease HII [Clostridia bacterium]
MLEYGFEQQFLSENIRLVCGVDEAGRGPLAGPVFAAACILPRGFVLEGLDDSKKLTEKKREALFDKITKGAVAYAIASASVEEIEEMNILNAALLAMRRAIEALEPRADFALIDGNVDRGFALPAKAIVGGDALAPSIAAASILAKVARDRVCYELDREYPQYGFAKHKGYGTKLHKEALLAHGPSPVHRPTFVHSFLYGKKK